MYVHTYIREITAPYQNMRKKLLAAAILTILTSYIHTYIHTYIGYINIISEDSTFCSKEKKRKIHAKLADHSSPYS